MKLWFEKYGSKCAGEWKQLVTAHYEQVHRCPLCALDNMCVSTAHWWVSFCTHLWLELMVSLQTLFSDLVLVSFMAIAALLAWGSFIPPWGCSQFFTDGSCSSQEPLFLGVPEHWSLSGGSFSLVAHSRDNTMDRIWPREKFLSLFISQTRCAGHWGYQTLV